MEMGESTLRPASRTFGVYSRCSAALRGNAVPDWLRTPRTATLRAMRAHSVPSSLLRSLVLGLLVLGILVKPVATFTCEVHDASHQVALGVVALAGAPADSDGHCCSCRSSHECCAPTPALLTHVEIALPVAADVALAQPLPVHFALTEQPVSLRPPKLA